MKKEWELSLESAWMARGGFCSQRRIAAKQPRRACHGMSMMCSKCGSQSLALPMPTETIAFSKASGCARCATDWICRLVIPQCSRAFSKASPKFSFVQPRGCRLLQWKRKIYDPSRRSLGHRFLQSQLDIRSSWPMLPLFAADLELANGSPTCAREMRPECFIIPGLQNAKR